MWEEIKIGEKCYYISKTVKEDTVAFNLTDFVNIWNESSTRETLLTRFKECNPLIKGNTEKLMDYIMIFLDATQTDVVRDITFSETNAILNMSTKKFIVKISFYFSLGKESPETFYRLVTLPLLLITEEFNFRQKKLCDMLEAKDQELLEHKLEGGIITRRKVITKEFDKDSFTHKCDKEVGLRANNLITRNGSVFSQDVGRLYSKILSSEVHVKLERIETESSSFDDNHSISNDLVKARPSRGKVIKKSGSSIISVVGVPGLSKGCEETKTTVTRKRLKKDLRI